MSVGNPEIQNDGTDGKSEYYRVWRQTVTEDTSRNYGTCTQGDRDLVPCIPKKLEKHFQ